MSVSKSKLTSTKIKATMVKPPLKRGPIVPTQPDTRNLNSPAQYGTPLAIRMAAGVVGAGAVAIPTTAGE